MNEYDKKAGKISELANMQPEALIGHLADAHRELTDVAPNIAPHIQAIAMKGINYLNSKLPKPVIEYPGQGDYEPSESQKEDWLELHNVVDDPISVLKHVQNGTLTGSHLDALKNVHPDLLNNMQQKVSENMTPNNMKSLDYPTKISLAKFLGHPLDESFMPGVIASDQANFSAPIQSAAGIPKRGKKSTLGGLKQLSLAKRTATQTQQDESTDD